MNELAKTLADRARTSVPQNTFTPAEWIEEYNRILVTLVVTECARLVDQAEPLNTWTKRYSQLIQEHFGLDSET